MQISDRFFCSVPERGDCLPKEKQTLERLAALGIPFTGLTHDPADTIELCAEIETRLSHRSVRICFCATRRRRLFIC